ncbi:MAG: hypothetical protein AB1668_01250 [Nanoarchaeota archaeon]
MEQKRGIIFILAVILVFVSLIHAFTMVSLTGKAVGSTQGTATLTIIEHPRVNLTFNLKDILYNTSLENINLTGGTNCTTSCIFNYTKTVPEKNTSVQTFNFVKSGFATNTTTLKILGNAEYTIYLNDTSAPEITTADFDWQTNGSANWYNINTTVNTTDNFLIRNVTFTYFTYPKLSRYNSTNGTINMSLLSAPTYNATFGPFNYSLILVSNHTAYDYYDYKNQTTATTFFIYVEGNITETITNVTTNVTTVVTVTIGGGGGAGGGMVEKITGVPEKAVCSAETLCTDWGPCEPDGKQKRQCVSVSKGCIVSKTTQEKDCKYIPPAEEEKEEIVVVKEKEEVPEEKKPLVGRAFLMGLVEGTSLLWLLLFMLAIIAGLIAYYIASNLSKYRKDKICTLSSLYFFEVGKKIRINTIISSNEAGHFDIEEEVDSSLNEQFSFKRKIKQ